MLGQNVIRLEFEGPSDVGLTALELDPNDFQSELPEQNWHVYYEDAEIGLSVGVWTTTSMQEAFGPYPGNEFMTVLEGQVVLVDGNGNETTVRTGETFVVRNGYPVSWKQEGFCRKFFLIYHPPDEQEIADGTNPGVMVMRKNEITEALKTGPDSAVHESSNDANSLKEAVCFKNSTDKMSVGMVEFTNIGSPVTPNPFHQLIQVLDGVIEVTEENGSVFRFSADDAFFIPKGTRCSWKAEGGGRYYFCNVE
ncbi:MAG: cupin domain-containing protein [Pseudomonadota bacterium]